MASASKSITITFDVAENEGGETGEGTEPRDLVLTIKDWCSDEIIVGASVRLTVGTVQTTLESDENGQVTFEAVEPGTHTLLITKAGYIDSDQDTLANDEVVV